MTRPLQLGRHHTLEVVGSASDGLRLRAPGGELLLPAGEAPEGAQTVRVFIYADRSGEPQATTKTPAATLGGFARMRCVSVTRAGAFMDWGLDKDLYVPPPEQAQWVVEGRDYVVCVRLDRKQERLIGTTHLANHFDYDVAHLRVDTPVTVLVYGRNDAGMQVVVDQRHRGLVHHADVFGSMRVGAERTGYIRNVRDDNRLDIGLTRRGKAGFEDAQEAVFEALVAAGGSLPLHDRSSPEDIDRHLGMSKKAFKRGVGGLYKARRIVLHEGSIAVAPASDDVDDA